MVLKWKVDFPTPVGTETRLAYIYLPRYYKFTLDKRYPVLYMFDGQNVFFDSTASFGKSWGMKSYLDYSKTDIIVVAVECNKSPENYRLNEYCPYDFEDSKLGYFEGFGKQTMDWYVNVLKKKIDKAFRTLPDRNHTYIAGSSMGGLMSLYALMEYNEYFCAAAALSPSLWTDSEKITDIVKHAHLRKNTRLYMDYGVKEFSNHDHMRPIFNHMTSLLLKKNVLLTSRIVPGGEHCEACWEEQIPVFMHVLLYEGFRNK